MKKIALLLVLALLTAGVSAVQAADTATQARLATKHVFAPEFSDLSGTTSDVTTDPNNFCFDGVDETDFFGGETASLNTFTTDTVTDPPGLQTYVYTWALLPPSGSPVIFGPFDCTFDLSGFNAGDLVNLCCGLFIELPSAGPVDIDWGSRVEDDDTSDRLQGLLDAFTLNP